MTRAQTTAVVETAPEKQDRICFPAPLLRLADFPMEQFACCALHTDVDAKQLLADLEQAPQFARLRPKRLLENARGTLGVILLTESDYYARQAAAYLASLSLQRRGAPVRTAQKEFWDDYELIGLDDEEDDDSDPAKLVSSSLSVISPVLLDPDLNSDSEDEGKIVISASGKKNSGFQLAKLNSPAVLIAAPSGPVLSQQVLAQIVSRDQEKLPLEIFIALKENQADIELIEELRFQYGFQVCRVGQADQPYLRRVLQSGIEELLMSDADVDLDKVIAHTRSFRGAQFEETDLTSAILWAVQRQNSGGPHLTTEDLLFQPLRLQERSAAKLDRMVGLDPVKDAVQRLTARAVLENRRRMAGFRVKTACRNLAFSGPPGTGKTVVAKLVADILREAGVGTGRFVAVGREQLIGRYLGHTSPMIAKLFQKAKGGVLFIDEAGALLGGEQDSYAAEAVNALVRHMELNPETVVIFATYPEEMERLLNANPGLSSRVARVLSFREYDSAQLWNILRLLAEEQDYYLPDEARDDCVRFFEELKGRKGENFGNGREARRLFDAAVEELALQKDADDFTAEHLRSAAAQLLDASGGDAPRSIGF